MNTLTWVIYLISSSIIKKIEISGNLIYTPDNLKESTWTVLYFVQSIFFFTWETAYVLFNLELFFFKLQCYKPTCRAVPGSPGPKGPSGPKVSPRRLITIVRFYIVFLPFYFTKMFCYLCWFSRVLKVKEAKLDQKVW